MMFIQHMLLTVVMMKIEPVLWREDLQEEEEILLGGI
ncbi:hypothetical protein AAZX31_20G205200 [Glycine max]